MSNKSQRNLKLYRPTKMSLIRILPLAIFFILYVVSIITGFADPTTGPPPPTQ
ncbi:MAG: hypothetical protein ACFE9L_17165 [Candidatus Hodarchaeota archaeon]